MTARTQDNQASPTTSPATRLNAGALKQVAEEGLKLRREIEQRAASMAVPTKQQQAQARMK